MNYDKGVYRSLTQILQFGINMIVPILLCTFLGIYLDRFFHTSFLVIIMFFIGAAAGGRNVYIFARQIFGKPPVHDEVKVHTSDFDESKRIASPHYDRATEPEKGAETDIEDVPDTEGHGI
ncbi:MAG: AtpZ/AtpI family protein [Lachnospiraceae bacterium]|nr:AtpZ/AtpI family protein [Lachnospiraceae bacterium]